MRTLVTGATGFSGSHLLRFLETKTDKVLGLDLREPEHQEATQKTDLVIGDLENLEHIKKICQDFSPELVFHLAALTTGASNFEVYRKTQQVNFLGTLNLLEALRCTAPNAKVLLIGSSAEYGVSQSKDNKAVDEKSYLYPLSAYGLSKLSQEILGHQYFRHFALPVFIVRPFNLIGAGQRVDFVCSSFAFQVAEMEEGLREPILELGNLHSKRDFIDVQDAVSAYWQVALKGEPSEAYNVCSGKLHSIAEVVEILSGLSRISFQVKVKDQRKRDVEVKALRGNNEKLASLGWSPKVLFQESLKGLLEYWRGKLKNKDKASE